MRKKGKDEKSKEEEEDGGGAFWKMYSNIYKRPERVPSLFFFFLYVRSLSGRLRFCCVMEEVGLLLCFYPIFHPFLPSNHSALTIHVLVISNLNSFFFYFSSSFPFLMNFVSTKFKLGIPMEISRGGAKYQQHAAAAAAALGRSFINAQL